MQELSILKANKKLPEKWGQQMAVMGVINITPDSFSDGGQYFDCESAVKQASIQVEAGVDVIDLGAQSTRPGANEIGEEEECKRLIGPLKRIRSQNPSILISVDTYNASVAEAALEAGADWINDVSGGRHDPKMLPLIAEANCPIVIMHSRGNSKTMERHARYKDIIPEIIEELNQQTETAIKCGVVGKNIIWDPGIGFAKTTSQNIEILKKLESITKNKFKVLVGPSRKRFIGEILDENNPKRRIWGTAAVVCRCVQADVAIVRVHDVKEMKQVVKVSQEIKSYMTDK